MGENPLQRIPFESGRLFISNLNEVAFFYVYTYYLLFLFFKEFIDLVSLEKVKVPGGIDNHDRY